MKLHDYFTESEQEALLRLTGGDPLDLDQDPLGGGEATEDGPDDSDDDGGEHEGGGEEEESEMGIAFVAG